MSNIYPGDKIDMPFMGNDVNIIVKFVPANQPFKDKGYIQIVDQYDDVHWVEENGDDNWITVNELIVFKDVPYSPVEISS